MFTVDATELKNRLGAVLARAEIEPVAIRKHGLVVAYLRPAQRPARAPRTGPQRSRGLSRRQEGRIARLCASGDLRPSRWARAGDPSLMAGIATMLASQPEFDRLKMLALAERLHPGMSTPHGFAAWLRQAPVQAARLLPLVRAQMKRPSP